RRDDVVVGVVALSDNLTWVGSRAAFRPLLRRARELVDDAEDADALEAASALDGLHFDMVPADQATRLAIAVSDAARELAGIADTSEDEWDRGYARSLRRLVIMLAPLCE